MLIVTAVHTLCTLNSNNTASLKSNRYCEEKKPVTM